MLACVLVLLAQSADRDPFLALSYAGGAFTYDSQDFAASAEPDNSVRVWKRQPGTRKLKLWDAFYPPVEAPPQEDPNALTFMPFVSPHGNFVAVSLERKGLYLYRVRPNSLKKTFNVVMSDFPRWSSDERELIVPDKDSAIVDDVADGKTRRVPIKGPFVFSRDNRYVMGCTAHGVGLVEVKSGKLIQKFEESLDTGVPYDLSPNGKWLITSGEDPNWHGYQSSDDQPMPADLDIHAGTIKLWRVKDGKRVKLWPGFSDAHSQKVFFLDNRRVLAPGNGEMYDVLTGKRIKKFREVYATNTHVGEVLFPISRQHPYTQEWAQVPPPPGVGGAVAFSPDGRLAIGSYGEDHGMTLSDVFTVWSTRDFTMKKLLHGARGASSGFVFLADGSMIESTLNGTAKFDREMNPVPLPRSPKMKDVFGETFMNSMQILPDGIHAVVRPMMGEQMSVYEIATGKVVKTLPIPTMGGEFQPGTYHMLSPARLQGEKQKSLYLHDPETRSVLWKNSDFPEAYQTSFSADGKLITGFAYPDRNSKSKKDIVFLIDANTGKTLGATETDEIPHKVILSPDSKTILLRSDRALELYDSSTMKRIAYRPLRFYRSVGDIAFSPDGKWIAAASDCMFVKVLRADTLQAVRTLIPFEDGNWISVDPTGKCEGSPGGLAKILK